jgi:RNA polymerase sigma-70 factor (ECF subfamily)
MDESAKDVVTRTLLEMQADGERSDPRLDPLIYEEVRRIAEKLMRGERAAHTLQPTELVHQAWLNLVDSTRVGEASRPVFLGLAARAMRRVLVDHARRRGRAKRGGDWHRVSLSGVSTDGPEKALDLLALEEALTELEALSERRALIVELRFFAGMSILDIADALGLSKTSVHTDWYTARAWLASRLPS